MLWILCCKFLNSKYKLRVKYSIFDIKIIFKILGTVFAKLNIAK